MNELEKQVYLQRLCPWCLIKPLPNMQRTVVGRFRTQNDAEGHMHALHSLMPSNNYIVVFDPAPDQGETSL